MTIAVARPMLREVSSAVHDAVTARRHYMITTLLLAAFSISGTAADMPHRLLGRDANPAPYIQLWTNKDDVFGRGDRVRVYFETDIDAYVTVIRVDTDGRVRMLFPLDPWDDNYARGGVSYELESRHGGYSFRVDDYPGQGYVFAIVSADPFRYSRYTRADHWDYRSIAEDGRVVGDPYVALGDIIDAIVPPNYVAYSYDVLPYYVERRYEYPRFLCYDCHTYAAWPYWDPYGQSCFRFRIVIYDDPYYYPARAYAGTSVVYRRPASRTIQPRYVFKDRTPGRDYVVTVRERPVDEEGRRRIEPGATRLVLGGGERLPTPVTHDASRPADRAGGRRVLPRPTDRRTHLRALAPQLERRDPNRMRRRQTNGAAKTRWQPERRAEPQRPPTRQAEPRRTGPRRNEPRRAEPQRNTPKRKVPRRPEPRRRRN